MNALEIALSIAFVAALGLMFYFASKAEYRKQQAKYLTDELMYNWTRKKMHEGNCEELKAENEELWKIVNRSIDLLQRSETRSHLALKAMVDLEEFRKLNKK